MAAPTSGPEAGDAAATSPAQPTRLDLRGTPCPLNFVRTRLALERIPPGSLLLVDLEAGEPERSVTEGLRAEGHAVEVQPIPETALDGTPAGTGVRLRIRRA